MSFKKQVCSRAGVEGRRDLRFDRPLRFAIYHAVILALQPLPDAQQKLTQYYDKLSKLEIQALPQIAEDVVRNRIDAAIADALGMKGDLSMLRKLLGAEPIIAMSLPA